jgi:hypothetical protein
MTPMATIAAAKQWWVTVEERDKARRRKEEGGGGEESGGGEVARGWVYHNVLGMGVAKAVNKWREHAMAVSTPLHPLPGPPIHYLCTHAHILFAA